MPRSNRICLEVYVDLDRTPGAFHTPESAREQVERILKEMIPHYEPRVLLPIED